jgi:O-ureido-D-serine cyclo-ligase
MHAGNEHPDRQAVAPGRPTSGKVALVGARAAQGLDEDMAPLASALRECGLDPHVVEWDDPGVRWGQYDLALLRSTWDYTQRLEEFHAWLGRVSAQTRLHNPHALVLWNTDKHYLRELAELGVPTVPGEFIEPGEDPAAAIEAFLDRQSCAELVVKPAVGAGSRGARRLSRAHAAEAAAHAGRLLGAGRSVLLQPYLADVDRHGETALVYFAGCFSHAIRKGPLLRPGEDPTRALFAPEHITSSAPDEQQLRVGAAVLGALALAGRSPRAPLYARVDLLRDGEETPRVLELELAEPSLFLGFAEGAAARLAREVARLL